MFNTARKPSGTQELHFYPSPGSVQPACVATYKLAGQGEGCMLSNSLTSKQVGDWRAMSCSMMFFFFNLLFISHLKDYFYISSKSWIVVNEFSGTSFSLCLSLCPHCTAPIPGFQGIFLCVWWWEAGFLSEDSWAAQHLKTRFTAGSEFSVQ